MAPLTKDDNLELVVCVGKVFAANAFLQVEHYGTCGVDERDVVFACKGVCGRRFAVCAQQDVGITQMSELLVVDGCESKGMQAFYLTAVVYDVPEAVEGLSLLQLLLGFVDGACHAKAEARTGVNLNVQCVRESVRVAIVSVRQWSCGYCRGRGHRGLVAEEPQHVWSRCGRVRVGYAAPR